MFFRVCGLGRASVVLAATLVVFTVADERLAQAQQPEAETTQPVGPSLSTWADGQDRLFVASLVDVGFLFLRPRFHFGWGRPHYQWLGIEANPILSNSDLGAYAGIRGAVPYGDLRVGARWRHAFRRSFLDPQDSFDHLDVSTRAGPVSQYISFEAQLTVGVPVGPGSLLLEATGTLIHGVPEDKWVFEDTIRVVAAPPLVWGVEVGYIFKAGPQERGRLGPVVELVSIPGRDAIIVRAGIVASMKLWKGLQLRGKFVPVLSSPDALGFSGGDSFLVGVRYQWATGAF